MAERNSASVRPRLNPVRGVFQASRAVAMTATATGVRVCPWPHRMPAQPMTRRAAEVVSSMPCLWRRWSRVTSVTSPVSMPRAARAKAGPSRPPRHPSREAKANARMPISLARRSRSRPTSRPVHKASPSRMSTRS